METRFDELSKVMASGLSRREVIRRVLGIAASAVFAQFGLAGGAVAEHLGGGTPTTNPCCPQARACFLAPDPTHPNGQQFCCPKGSICVPVPGSTFGQCCRRDQIIYEPNAAGVLVPVGCCPDGKVFDPNSPDLCGCPRGTLPLPDGTCCPKVNFCASASGAPICCPDGTVCVPPTSDNPTPCCPKGQVIYTTGAAGKPIPNGCCPQGQVFTPNGPTPCGCRHGSILINGTCCPAGQVCGVAGTAPVCCPPGQSCVNGTCACPTGTVFIDGRCCPTNNVCGPPTVPQTCCTKGSVCISGPNGFECCPSRQVYQPPGTTTSACCPPGLVASSDKTTCVCPGGANPCGVSSTGAPLCCPPGSVCIVSPPPSAPSCCPKAQTVFNDGVAVLCCPDGQVFNPNSPTMCGCPRGTVLTVDDICCKKANVCRAASDGPAVCCADRSKCVITYDPATNTYEPTCVCPDDQHPCPSPVGTVCCHARAICLATLPTGTGVGDGT